MVKKTIDGIWGAAYTPRLAAEETGSETGFEADVRWARGSDLKMFDIVNGRETRTAVLLAGIVRCTIDSTVCVFLESQFYVLSLNFGSAQT